LADLKVQRFSQSTAQGAIVLPRKLFSQATGHILNAGFLLYKAWLIINQEIVRVVPWRKVMSDQGLGAKERGCQQPLPWKETVPWKKR
jgi:hypothetical protein